MFKQRQILLEYYITNHNLNDENYLDLFINELILTEPNMQNYKKDLTRFLRKIEFSNINDCWEWRELLASNGYGRINIGGTMFLSHRISYELFNSELLDLHCCHRCDNKKCINPFHLFSGTNSDNMQDKINKNRHSKGTDLSSLTEEQVIQIYQDSRQYKTISKDYNASVNRIRDIKLGITWKHIYNKYKGFIKLSSREGEGNGSAVLNSEMVLNIKELSKSKNVQKISEELNLKYGTVYNVVKGLTWKHVV